MTSRRDCEQLRALRAEVKSLTDNILNPDREVVIGFYKDYRFDPKGIPKFDVGLEHLPTKRAEMEKVIDAKKEEIARRVADIEKWLDGVEDAEMRTILRMYYGQGKTHKEIGEVVHLDRSVVSRRIKRFWQIQQLHTKHTKSGVSLI